MMRRLGIFAIILLCSLQASALDAVVAHTVFYVPHTGGALAPSIDLYWQINPNTLHYNTNAEKMIVARVKTDIVFTNNAGIIKEDHYILQTVPRASLDELAQHSIIELRRYELPAGKVKLLVRLTDLSDSVNRFVYSDSFTVAPPSPSAPFFSEVELMDTVFDAAAETVFKKNGRQQVPTCANFINDGTNTLRYYAELYETGHASTSDYPLVQKVSISKSPVAGYYGDFQKKDTITTPGKLTLVSGSFNIASLPSGNYYIRVTLENNSKQDVASATYFFQRMNKHPFVPEVTKKAAAASDTGMENVTVLNLSKTFLAKYSLGQVRAILKMLLPFSDQQGTSTINGFLKKPDEMYMRYYIYNYFTAINKEEPAKAWKEFSSKITAVNKLYNAHGTPGYETERGFMYLRYGAPTEVITVENEQGAFPYQIWQYNVLTQRNQKDIANAVFLFYKPNQLNDYQLLHSTVSGEVQYQGWRSTLYTNSEGGKNTNSRAEQYLGNR